MNFLGAFLVIFCILLIHAPKDVYLQNGATTEVAPTTNGMNESPNNAPATSAPAANGSPPANGAPTTTDDSQQPSMPTDNGVKPQVSPDVVEYLNNRIKQLLQQNPAKEPSDLRLAAVFNEKRLRLKDALIREPAQMGDDIKAEDAIQHFKKFAQKYDVTTSRLEQAIDNLKSIQDNPDLPITVKYKALMLLQTLKHSSSIEDAEKALNEYENFNMNMGLNATPLPPAMSSLNDDYVKYFEEILMILKQNATTMEDPEFQNFFNDLLNNPEQLKQLWIALTQLSEEESDEDDYFDDLFSIISSFL